MIIDEDVTEDTSVDLSSLTPHPTMSGFFKIQGFDCYINKFGKVWCEKRKHYLRPNMSFSKETGRFGYPKVWLGSAISRSIHLTVAEYFVKKPDSFFPLEVNHIDGNKANFAAYNLEWVTSSENHRHAVETGLRSNLRPVILKDLESGIEKDFSDVASCARYLGCDPAPLHRYMLEKRIAPFKLRWDVVYKGKPWNPIPSNNIGLRHASDGRAIVAVNKVTKTIFIFANLARAISVTGVSRAIIQRRLINNKLHPKEKSSSGPEPMEIDWVFFHQENQEADVAKIKQILATDGDIELPSLVPALKSGTKVGKLPSPIRTIDSNGEEKFYPSLKTFAKENNIKYKSLWQALSTRGQWNNLRFEYLKPQR